MSYQDNPIHHEYYKELIQELSSEHVSSRDFLKAVYKLVFGTTLGMLLSREYTEWTESLTWTYQQGRSTFIENTFGRNASDRLQQSISKLDAPPDGYYPAAWESIETKRSARIERIKPTYEAQDLSQFNDGESDTPSVPEPTGRGVYSGFGTVIDLTNYSSSNKYDFYIDTSTYGEKHETFSGSFQVRQDRSPVNQDMSDNNGNIGSFWMYSDEPGGPAVWLVLNDDGDSISDAGVMFTGIPADVNIGQFLSIVDVHLI